MQGPTPRQWPFADLPRQRSAVPADDATPATKKAAAKPAPVKRAARAHAKKPVAARKSRR